MWPMLERWLLGIKPSKLPPLPRERITIDRISDLVSVAAQDAAAVCASIRLERRKREQDLLSRALNNTD